MRTMVWFCAVSDATGLRGKQLDRYHPPGRLVWGTWKCATLPASPGNLWRRYKAGTSTPTGRRVALRGLTLVEFVDIHFPGTAAWFNHSLWNLLERDSKFDLDAEIAGRLPARAVKEISAGRYIATEAWRPMGSKSTLQGTKGRPRKGRVLTLEDLEYLLMRNVEQPKPYILPARYQTMGVITALFALLIHAERSCRFGQHSSINWVVAEDISKAAYLSIREWEERLRADQFLSCVASVLLERANSLCTAWDD
jgi:hypothetical protein